MLWVAWLVFVLLVPPARAAPKPRIVGGEPVPLPRDSYPYFALVYANDQTGQSWRCGGTLIAPDWVLTAAHCLSGLTGWYVRLGVRTRSNFADTEVFAASQAVIHPQYNSTSYDNDLGLLQLGGRSAFAPVQLDVGDGHASDVGSAVVVIGFGGILPSPADYSSSTDEANVSPMTLQRVKLGILNGDFWCGRGFNHATQICIGDLPGEFDSCYGDSGGPALSNVDESWGVGVQVGIVSYGWGCGRMYDRGVYTRVSAYIGWIRSIVSDMPPPDVVPAGHVLFPANGSTTCASSPFGRTLALDCGALSIVKILAASWIHTTVFGLRCGTRTSVAGNAPSSFQEQPASIGPAVLSCVGTDMCFVPVTALVFGHVPSSLQSINVSVAVYATCGYLAPPPAPHEPPPLVLAPPPRALAPPPPHVLAPPPPPDVSETMANAIPRSQLTQVVLCVEAVVIVLASTALVFYLLRDDSPEPASIQSGIQLGSAPSAVDRVTVGGGLDKV
jgi:secreted trypsin-like serine protease